MNRLIGILVFDEVDELDFIGVFEVLKKAALYVGIEVLTIGSKKSLLGANGLSFHSDAMFSDIKRCSALVIPGGRGIHACRSSMELQGELVQAWKQGLPFYAICSGVFLLAYFGLLQGKTVAVHHEKWCDLQSVTACRIQQGLVRDGSLVSIGGDGSSPWVKGVRMGFEILKDFASDAIPFVSQRLELRFP